MVASTGNAGLKSEVIGTACIHFKEKQCIQCKKFQKKFCCLAALSTETRGNEETHPVVDDIQDGFIIQADNARLDQQLHTVRQILQMTQTKMILDTPTSLEKKTGLSQLTDNTFKTGDT
ncbi:uncharacterized protein LOC134874415 isoform X4 [Eleginops maclovinus]|uniref:uncharacterized protein LOC134874415 isoform X4 n=1 Tax=Eleginops maclovinus TaxID=56733 RepID=UPI003080ACAF